MAGSPVRAPRPPSEGPYVLLRMQRRSRHHSCCGILRSFPRHSSVRTGVEWSQSPARIGTPEAALSEVDELQGPASSASVSANIERPSWKPSTLTDSSPGEFHHYCSTVLRIGRRPVRHSLLLLNSEHVSALRNADRNAIPTVRGNENSAALRHRALTLRRGDHWKPSQDRTIRNTIRIVANVGR